MASGTAKWYLYAFKSAFNKEFDFDDGGTKIMHTSVTHTPDQDAHQYKSSLTNEVTGTNVPAGGTVLANCTITVTGATNVIKFDADDYSVSSATATGIINSHIYNGTAGTDATRALMCFIVWDSTMSPNNGTLSVIFDSAGIVTVTPA